MASIEASAVAASISMAAPSAITRMSTPPRPSPSASTAAGIEAGVGFFTLQTAISGSGALTKSGGLVTLTGHQTYLGNTTIQSGLLKINEGSLPLRSSPSINGGTLLALHAMAALPETSSAPAR